MSETKLCTQIQCNRYVGSIHIQFKWFSFYASTLEKCLVQSSIIWKMFTPLCCVHPNEFNYGKICSRRRRRFQQMKWFSIYRKIRRRRRRRFGTSLRPRSAYAWFLYWIPSNNSVHLDINKTFHHHQHHYRSVIHKRKCCIVTIQSHGRWSGHD